MDVVSSSELPEDENEIILNQDGTWKPLPREEESVEEPLKETGPHAERNHKHNATTRTQ